MSSINIPTLTEFLVSRNSKRISLSAVSRHTGVKYSRLLKVERGEMEMSELTINEIQAINDLLFPETNRHI